AERPDRLLGLAVRPRADQAGHDDLLVDIQPTAPLVDDVHGALPPRDDGRAGCRARRRLCRACFPSGSDNRWRLRAPGVQLASGLAAPGECDLVAPDSSRPQHTAATRPVRPFSYPGGGP